MKDFNKASSGEALILKLASSHLQGGLDPLSFSLSGTHSWTQDKPTYPTPTSAVSKPSS